MSQPVQEVTIPEPQTLEVGGGGVSYRRRGSGTPTLFLHSAGGSGEWGPFHDALAADRDLIIPDHPGFGGSDDYASLKTIDDLVYHYLDLLDALGLDRVDLIGASFGGWIAAELAVHSPERFPHVVLLGPAGLRIPGASIADLFIMTPPQLIGALFHDRGLVETILATPPTTEEVLRLYRDLGALGRFGWNPYLSNPRLEARLHRVRSRTLVVAAGEDRIIPLEHCRRYAERIRDAELLVIPDVGHALYGERPDLVTQAVVDFLEN